MTENITPQQAMGKLDDLRAGLTHDKACEQGLPGASLRCPGCETDNAIAPITGYLWDGYGAVDVLAATRHAVINRLPYGIGQAVDAIVASIAW